MKGKAMPKSLTDRSDARMITVLKFIDINAGCPSLPITFPQQQNVYPSPMERPINTTMGPIFAARKHSVLANKPDPTLAYVFGRRAMTARRRHRFLRVSSSHPMACFASDRTRHTRKPRQRHRQWCGWAAKESTSDIGYPTAGEEHCRFLMGLLRCDEASGEKIGAADGRRGQVRCKSKQQKRQQQQQFAAKISPVVDAENTSHRVPSHANRASLSSFSPRAKC